MDELKPYWTKELRAALTVRDHIESMRAEAKARCEQDCDLHRFCDVLGVMSAAERGNDRHLAQSVAALGGLGADW